MKDHGVVIKAVGPFDSKFPWPLPAHSLSEKAVGLPNLPKLNPNSRNPYDGKVNVLNNLSDVDVKSGGSLGALKKWANSGTGFPLHPSSLHIQHSYIIPQYNTSTVTLDFLNVHIILHIILRCGPPKWRRNRNWVTVPLLSVL